MRRRALLAASGASGGGGFGEEILFYLGAAPFGPLHELKALNGMTWVDWIDSEYNTVGIWREHYNDFVLIFYPPMGFNVRNRDGSTVNGNDIIIAENRYNVG